MITVRAILTQKYDSPSNLVSFVIFKVKEKFTFQEGQFMMIETEIKGKVTKKPYSIATTNQQLQEKGEIGFIIKKVSENGMSDFLTQKVNIKTPIILKGALGHYTDKGQHQNYLFIATGSGLSPNLGLYQHLVYESKNYANIVNIYGERYYKHIIPKVEGLFFKHGQKNITNIFHLSRDKETKNKKLEVYKSGYVQESLTKAIDILGVNTSCFLCGMPAMVDDVRKKLQVMGIDKKNITFEKY